MSTTKSFNITGGPNKYDLVMGFYYAYDKRSLHRPEFRIECGSISFTAPVVLRQVGHEDGSGESFMIEGRIDGQVYSGREFRGYYDARSRRGYMDLVY
jgi:hypothetical protein